MAVVVVRTTQKNMVVKACTSKKKKTMHQKVRRRLRGVHLGEKPERLMGEVGAVAQHTMAQVGGHRDSIGEVY